MMGTTTKDTISPLAPGQGVLARLRALAAESSSAPLFEILHAADQQAALLRTVLPTSTRHILTELPRLIPSIRIEYISAMPVSGVSFWSNSSWKIHIRVGDRLDTQVFAVLHQLKHIIDDPLRRQQPNPYLPAHKEWEREKAANVFAVRVLRGEPSRTATKNYDPAGGLHVSLRSMTRKGGSL